MRVYKLAPRYLYTRCGMFTSCCITSGVYERVHSISQRTLYYITPPRFLRGLSPNKSYISLGGWGYLFECYSLFKKLPFNLCLGKGKDIPYFNSNKKKRHRGPEMDFGRSTSTWKASTTLDIRKAYKNLALKFHPDEGTALCNPSEFYDGLKRKRNIKYVVVNDYCIRRERKIFCTIVQY